MAKVGRETGRLRSNLWELGLPWEDRQAAPIRLRSGTAWPPRQREENTDVGKQKVQLSFLGRLPVSQTVPPSLNPKQSAPSEP